MHLLNLKSPIERKSLGFQIRYFHSLILVIKALFIGHLDQEISLVGVDKPPLFYIFFLFVLIYKYLGLVFLLKVHLIKNLF